MCCAQHLCNPAIVFLACLAFERMYFNVLANPKTVRLRLRCELKLCEELPVPLDVLEVIAIGKRFGVITPVSYTHLTLPTILLV